MGTQLAHLDLASAGVESIETSVLDPFLEIKADWVRCTTYRQRAEELKASVRPAVYQRVIDDYSHRLAELNERLAPMLPQMRVEYQKLDGLVARLKTALEQAELRREELQFRHAVGELSEPELAEARLEPDRMAAQYEGELAAAERLRARFASALGEEVGGDPQLSTDAAPDDLRTNLVHVTDAAGAAANPSAGSGLLEFNQPGETFVLPVAALVVENIDGGQPVEHRLGGLNFIGRTPDNHIQVAAPNISRRHAVVEIANAGYRIRDLESQNGTFVNGERIREHTLVDGDHIRIGETEFVFQRPMGRASAGDR
jgi:hypothetical protein